MQMIEQRFSGRDANLTKIKRAIDRQLARGKLRRVEVRYSPEATQTMHEDQAKAAIVDLLLEHGMQGAEVSVRARLTAPWHPRGRSQQLGVSPAAADTAA